MSSMDRYYNNKIIRPSACYFQELPFTSELAIQKAGFNYTKKYWKLDANIYMEEIHMYVYVHVCVYRF